MPKVVVVVVVVVMAAEVVTVAAMAADTEVGMQVVWEGTAEMATTLEPITLARPHAIME